MVQNMQRYFGFKVVTSSILHPSQLHLLSSRLSSLVESKALSLDNHLLYLHQLAFIEDRSQHYDELHMRLSKVYVDFRINKKQCHSGTMMFANNKFDAELAEKPPHFYLAHHIGYTVSPDTFSDRSGFQNIIMTIVNKRIAQKDRKIKVTVSVVPSKDFSSLIRNKIAESSATSLDIRFNRATEFSTVVQLSLGNPVGNQLELDFSQDLVKTDIENNGVNTPTVFTNVVLREHVLRELSQLLDQLDILRDNDIHVPPEDIKEIKEMVNSGSENPGVMKGLGKFRGWIVAAADRISISLLTEVIKSNLM